MFRNLTKIIHTKYGRILLSILLGLGLASLFRKSCKHRNCMLFKAPHMNEIKKDVYKHDNKCYVFEHQSVECDPSKKIVEFKDTPRT